jgi:hypothetical protein
MSVEQADVEVANRNGRLHPSQRGKVLDFNFWAAAVLVVAGIVVSVIIPVRSISTGFGTKATLWDVGAVLGTVIPILALAAWFAFVCWRRLADVREGRLLTITGWTHDFGRQRRTEDYPIMLYTRLSQGSNEQYFLKAGGKEHRIYAAAKLRERIQADRNNTVYLTPRTKLLINVLPA